MAESSRPSGFRHPFQKLCYTKVGSERSPVLLAASACKIVTLSLHDGSILATYPARTGTFQAGGLKGDHDEAEEDSGRPPKRQKLDSEEAVTLPRQDSEDSVEIVAERQKGQRRKPKVETSKLPNISHVLAAADGEQVVVVTAEDKSINCMHIDSTGRLKLQSRRIMPKRLCAVVLTPDESTILAGDKFGDVYSLPLVPQDDYYPRQSRSDGDTNGFKPSATELTVHTKGNLEALRQQREQKQAQQRKEGPDFEHKLLLGHVSLLTDVAIVEIPHHQRARQYILSADRDEHIRVSRGISQAHIIENYCLGHRDFVSKLCILPWTPEFLVAGSGEPSLKVYQWQSGQITDEELFTGAVQQDIINAFGTHMEERALSKIAVAGIWPFQHQTVRLVLVALEGLPLILSYAIDHLGHLRHHQTITLAGNALDIAVMEDRATILISIDTLHAPGSMKIVRPAEIPASELLETFQLVESNPSTTNGEAATSDAPSWQPSSLAMVLNAHIAEEEELLSDIQPQIEATPSSKSPYSQVGEFLYGLENLRKKRFRDTTGEVDAPGPENDDFDDVAEL